MPNGALRLVLQACNDLPAESDGYLRDVQIARQTRLRLSEVRDCIECLDDRGFLRSARLTDGLKVQITAEGRLFLSQRRGFPEESSGGREESGTIRVGPEGQRSDDEDERPASPQPIPAGVAGDGTTPTNVGRGQPTFKRPTV